MLKWMNSLGKVRIALSMLAMLGALWAAVDLHQHLPGLHKSVECVACSIEQSTGHGFAPQADIQASPVEFADAETTCTARGLASSCVHTARIRAPPLS